MKHWKGKTAAVLAAVCLMIAGCSAGAGAAVKTESAADTGSAAEIGTAAESGNAAEIGTAAGTRNAADAATTETMVSAKTEATGSGKDTEIAETETAEAAAADAEASAKASTEPGSGHAQTASDKETVTQQQVVTLDMTPVYGTELKDGVYTIQADSSSGMFRIAECSLTVKDGSMRAVMTMGGTGYLKLYMGTGEEAAAADEADCIPYVETAEGAHTFEVPVEALDMGIDCSAFSKNKEKWYDRVLVFRSDSLPAEAFVNAAFTTAESLGLEDGQYTAEVILEGGSGRASVESPAVLCVEQGKVSAVIVWGSANYDYMKINDQKIEWTGAEEHSTFEIPVEGFDRKIPVIADTVAMSVPHEVSYTLTFDSSSLKKVEP